jgi:RNA polymerase sigma-70 factor (ECF subfamily)
MTPTPRIPANGSCPSTDWSVVRAAGDPEDTAGKAALENLCSRYWHPIYAFIRRRGAPEAKAQDLTQAFFIHILEKHFLERADPQNGSFRGYLLKACRNFVINEWKKEKKEILNGRVMTLASLELPAPDEQFDLDWAFAVLNNALKAVRHRYADRGNAAHFDCFRAYLPLHDGQLPGPQAEAAKQLGITVENFKKKLHDLREEFNRQVRHDVAQTLFNPEDVEQEIGQLLASVRGLSPASVADAGQPTQEAL